jgi:hypothetical protein
MLSIITAKAWKFRVRLRKKQINLALGYQEGTFHKSEMFSIRLLFMKLTIFAAKNERLKWLKSAGSTFHRVPSHMQQPVKSKVVTKKVKPTEKKKVPSTKNVNTSSVPLDIPSMGTRSKKKNTTTKPGNEYTKQEKT